MKKICFTVSLAMVLMAGNAIAQSTVTTQSTPVVKNTEVDKKVVSTDRSVLSVNPNQPSTVTTVRTESANQQGAIGPNESLNVNVQPVVKTKITKAQLDTQTERGREYILAHPELYTIEE